MKELRCNRCSKYLGEMVEGKIKKDAVLICKECLEAYKTLESLGNYSKGVGGGNKTDIDFFNGIFGGKLK